VSAQFPNLFSPIKIGAMTVKNRIVSPGHQTGFAADNMISDRLIAYHEARAKGGAGLICTESISVHPSYELLRPFKLHILSHEDRIIPWFQKLADALHAYDCKVIAQFSHGGAYGPSAFMYPLAGPSDDIYETTCEMARELEKDEIKELVEVFGSAAGRAKKGGLDGAEVLNAYGNLVPQFMAPLTNRRTDEYGGSLENRLRFPMEVVDAMRANTDSDFVIGMRISGDDLIDGGLTLEDMKVIMAKLAPKLDYINVSFSSHVEILSEGLQVFTMAIPLGAFVYIASGIKEAIPDKPIIAVGRINDPVQAEQVLAEGHADMVAMARALIADPEWPNKAKEGRLADIRTCIACNQACAGHLENNYGISCIQNPVTGRELQYGKVEPAKKQKKVVVVGGGPGGMEAAWSAARRGHKVVLFEKSNQLGGQTLIASKAPFRTDIADVARNLSRQVEQEKSNITVKLGVEATVQTVMDENPDAVVVATGSKPFTPPFIAGIDKASVVTDWDVLEGKARVGDKVVVLDSESRHRSSSVAEFLRDQGKEVTLITRQHRIGLHLIIQDRALVLQRLMQKKVGMKTCTWLKEVRDGDVVAYNTLTREEEVIPADNVVLAMGGKAERQLYRELKGKVKELYSIGDCLGPRNMEPAIYEGFYVGTIL
jgi:mycofactocin system FadH/OYE family oxidoreductase 2